MSCIHNSSESIVNFVSEITQKIKKESDLSPRNPVINTLLSKLVEFATEQHDSSASAQAIKHFEEQGLLEHIQALCQRAESLMEGHFSALISTSKN